MTSIRNDSGATDYKNAVAPQHVEHGLKPASLVVQHGLIREVKHLKPNEMPQCRIGKICCNERFLIGVFKFAKYSTGFLAVGFTALGAGLLSRQDNDPTEAILPFALSTCNLVASCLSHRELAKMKGAL